MKVHDQWGIWLFIKLLLLHFQVIFNFGEIDCRESLVICVDKGRYPDLKTGANDIHVSFCCGSISNQPNMPILSYVKIWDFTGFQRVESEMLTIFYMDYCCILCLAFACLLQRSGDVFVSNLSLLRSHDRRDRHLHQSLEKFGEPTQVQDLCSSRGTRSQRDAVRFYYLCVSITVVAYNTVVLLHRSFFFLLNSWGCNTKRKVVRVFIVWRLASSGLCINFVLLWADLACISLWSATFRAAEIDANYRTFDLKWNRVPVVCLYLAALSFFFLAYPSVTFKCPHQKKKLLRSVSHQIKGLGQKNTLSMHESIDDQGDTEREADLYMSDITANAMSAWIFWPRGIETQPL